MKAILLAAGAGRRFGEKTKTLPKCLIPLGNKGETLLSRYLDSFRKLEILDVVMVCGHQQEKIKKECRRKGRGLRIRFLFNKDYAKGSVVSLYTARDEFDETCLIMDADVYFETRTLKRLIDSRLQSAFLIDPRVKGAGEEMMVMARHGTPCLISKKIDPRLEILGEATGFFKISHADGMLLRKTLQDFVLAGRTGGEYEEAYNGLMRKRKVGVEKIGSEFWKEMDFKEDWEKIVSHLGRLEVCHIKM